MNTLRNWLAGLLGLQLVLAAGLFVNASANRSTDVADALITFDESQLDKVVIGDGSNQLTLVKQENAWQLPELHDLPASTGKLENALDKLANLTISWPVATTTSAHSRFEVSEEKHQRRIQLYSEDKLAGELFLGSSPGFRKVHVRSPDADEVYALSVNTYEFPVKDSDWLDKKLLAVDDITRIKGPDFTLKKQNDAWTLTGDDETGTNVDQVDSEKANQLRRAFSSLTVTGVAEPSPVFDSEDVITLEVNGGSDGENQRYQFLAIDDRYYAKSDHFPQVFTLSQYDYERLATVKLETLRLAESKPVSTEPLTSTTSATTSTGEAENSGDS